MKLLILTRVFFIKSLLYFAFYSIMIFLLRSPISPSYSSPGGSSILPSTTTTAALNAATSSSASSHVVVDRATAAAAAAAAEVTRTSVIQNAANADMGAPSNATVAATAAALGLSPQLAQQLTPKQISALEKEYLMAAEQEKMLSAGRQFTAVSRQGDDKPDSLSSPGGAAGANPFEGKLVCSGDWGLG